MNNIVRLELPIQNVQLIWEALENGNFPGRIAELVAETKARINNAVQIAQMQPGPEVDMMDAPIDEPVLAPTVEEV